VPCTPGTDPDPTMKTVSLVLQLLALVASVALVTAFAGATYFEMTGSQARLLPGVASLVFGLVLVLQHLLPRPRTGPRFLSLGAAVGLVVLAGLEIRHVVRGGFAASMLLGVFSASLLPRGTHRSP
jgi:hypothetical protein